MLLVTSSQVQWVSSQSLLEMVQDRAISASGTGQAGHSRPRSHLVWPSRAISESKPEVTLKSREGKKQKERYHLLSFGHRPELMGVPKISVVK